MTAWSWPLAALSLLACWLLGRKHPAGWLCAVAVNLAWLPYAVVTSQPGFVLAELAFLWLNLRGWRAWRTPHPGPRHAARRDELPLPGPLAAGIEGRGPYRLDDLLAFHANQTPERTPAR